MLATSNTVKHTGVQSVLTGTRVLVGFVAIYTMIVNSRLGRSEGMLMAIGTDPQDHPLALDFTGETSPYPFFAQKRRTEPVWHGALMDQSQAPPELLADDEWSLFGYDDVFHAFRDDRVFSSHNYDQTIGLVIGHTILAMSGKEHHDHRSLVAKAFRATALERWEPTVIRPVCDQLVDEIKHDGVADLVQAVTFEFPTRITAALLGLPREDLDLFRRLSFDLISIPVDIEAGLNASAELYDYFLAQVEQRRRKITDDIIGDLVAAEIDGAKLTDEAIISFLRLLLPPAWKPPTVPRATCCTCCSPTPNSWRPSRATAP